MKRKELILTIPFCAFIGVMMLMFFFMPKKTVSENEKRTLKTPPEFSVKNVLNSTFEKDTEDYINDHFPFREQFTAIDANYLTLTGRNGQKGIYKGKDGYLINTPVHDKNNQLDRSLASIRAFTDSINIHANIMIIPSTGYIMSDKLPANHDEYRDSEYLEKAWIATRGSNVTWIDLHSAFLASKNNIQLYYKTDHHWTSRGAYLAYRMYADEHAFAPAEKNEFEIYNHDGFYGTAYSKSALWSTKPDNIEVWDYPNRITVQIDENGLIEDYNNMFFREHLKNMDKYPVFLNGNHAMTKITNPESSNGRLLIIKDSFAHCLAPFLARDYSEVDMVDLRYYQGRVSDIISNYDEVLFVYGISSLMDSSDIEILN